MFSRIFFITSVIVLGVTFFAHAQIDTTQEFKATPLVSEQIERMDIHARINADASVSVIEKITYNFGDENRHGIYRTIPLGFTAKGQPGHTEIEVQSVTDEKGNLYNYDITSSDPINVKIGDADTTITGVHTYNIAYTLKRAIGYFDTYDEWYWNITGDEWDVPIQQVTAEIVVPKELPLADLKFKDYCGSKGDTASCGVFTQKDSTTLLYTKNTDTVITSGEGVTIAVGFPKGLVAIPTQAEFFWAWFAKVWFWPFPFVIWFLWFKKQFAYMWKRRQYFSARPIVAEYDAHGFTPLEVSLLVHKTIKNKDLSAAIVGLAVAGYITIENKDDEFCFSHKKDIESTATESDRALFRMLDSVCESQFTSIEGEAFASVMELAASPLNARNYTINKKTKKGIAILPFFLAINPGAFVWLLAGIGPAVIFSGACVLIGITLLFLKKADVRLTEKGFDAEHILLGLKEYIQVAEKDRINLANAPAKTPELFEKLLPYAMVFGLEKKWAKEFEGLYVGAPSWYVGGAAAAFSTLAFVDTVRSTASSVDTAIVSSVQSSSSSSWSSSSGGSSGSGSSGGGGGGGGGGSW